MAVVPDFSRRRLAGAASLVALALIGSLSLAGMPAGAAPAAAACDGAPVLDLANPSPGAVVSVGDYVVSGVARDPLSADGNGVESVELFLGPRDFGGAMIGSAVPEAGVFRATVELPTTANGRTDFVAYAQSSITGRETVVTVPVYIGAAPTPTPRPDTEASNASSAVERESVACTPGAVNGTAVAAAQPAVPAAAAQGGAQAPAAASATTGAPVLELANPRNGDIISFGDYVISGSARVAGSTNGAGVDRVDLFLESRETGGRFLGSATPSESGRFDVEVEIPGVSTGGTTLYAYASSSLTGEESVVGVPVFVGITPTPTPRPS